MLVGVQHVRSDQFDHWACGVAMDGVVVRAVPVCGSDRGFWEEFLDGVGKVFGGVGGFFAGGEVELGGSEVDDPFVEFDVGVVAAR